MNNSSTISFIKEDPWRIFRIMAEFVDSFEALSQVGPGVTIFGSARTKPNNPYYEATVTSRTAAHYVRAAVGRPRLGLFARLTSAIFGSSVY